jgi:hypothetical protein
VDAFSLGRPYRSGEPLSPESGTINGKLLTNQTTVIVDITSTTTLVRAAEDTASFPWSNGTIESVCTKVIRAFRAVLSELKMYADEWPEVLNVVQSVLNNSLSTRLEKRKPMQVFTGDAKYTPLSLMLKNNVPVNAPLDFIKAQKLMEVKKLSKAMTEIHAQVAEKATRDRKAAIQKHNDETHVRSPNF